LNRRAPTAGVSRAANTAASASAAAIVLIASGLPGCADPLDAASATASQRNLCLDENATLFQALADECRRAWEHDLSCVGIVGFHGDLEGAPVMADSRFFGVRFVNVIRRDGSALRQQVRLDGRTPHFEFSVAFMGVGGLVADGELDRRTVLGGSAGDLEDDKVLASLRISTVAQSKDLGAREGFLLTRTQKEGEQSGRFDVKLGQARSIGAIEGCFIAFPTTVELIIEAGADDGS